jgi:hypothetical protein
MDGRQDKWRGMNNDLAGSTELSVSETGCTSLGK